MARKLGLIISLVILAFPAVASAETFCVHSPANCAGTSKADLQAALDAANVNGVNTKDTISLGVGLFNDGPAVAVAGNPVDIVGTAINQTALRSSSAQGGLVILDIQEPASTISHLRVHHNSAAPSATGIVLAGGANDVYVTNQGFSGQFDGIRMVGTQASLDDSTVSLVYPSNVQNRAVFVPAGADVNVSDSLLAASVGAFALGALDMRRTRILATQGVTASGGSTTSVRDSEIRVPGTFSSNFQPAALAAAGNGATTLDADRVTAYSSAAGSSFGAWVAPNPGAGNDAKIDLQGSVLDGFSLDLVAGQSAGSTAKVLTSWSAYGSSSTAISGGATYTPAPNNLDLTGVDPGFFDPAAGNLRLRHDSPLMDQGDPAFQPFLGGLDVGSLTRVRDGDGAGGAVVDIGAREYQRRAPVADAQATPATAGPGQAISFDASQSTDPDLDPLTYAWSFDDGASATGATAQHAFAAAGTHTATVTVTDATGLTAGKTVSVDVQAPAQPAPGGQPAPGQPGPGATNAAPLLSGLRLAPPTFRARQLRRARGAARRRPPVGTTIRFRLSEAATVTFAIDRARAGRRVGKSCRKPTRANRTRRPCTRWVKVGGFARSGQAGENALRFDGRLAGQAMSTGRYRLRARARDSQGLRSAPVAPRRFAIAGS